MNFLLQKTNDIMWKSDTLFMEFWAALYTLISGVMFYFNQIQSYYTGSVYEIISAVLSQDRWGLVLIVIGICQFIAIYSNQYRFQKMILMFSTIFWVFTASIVGFGDGHTWVFFNIIMVAIAHIWLYLRTSRKVRIRREVHNELDVTWNTLI